ncbi:hypothetical protein [Kordiimonas sp.]|uniref:hypothetical protein n=1 Tax=Kordiimonas sp. TaxID=1970157 RepID=UPI003A8CB8A9
MKKLIVHMGAHRCASSATQALLRRNRGEIEAHNVALYLREDLASEVQKMAVNRLYEYRFWKPSSQMAVARISATLATLPADTILISEENLMGIMPGHLGHGFYEKFDQFCRALSRLKKAAEVHPRLIVRRQDNFIESAYGFRVAFGLREDFKDFAARFKPGEMSWHRMATAFERHGIDEHAKIDVLEAWPQDGKTDHLLRFLELEGLTLEGGGLRSGNSRFGEDGLSLLLAMNRTGMGLDIAWRRDVLFPALRKADKPTPELVQDLLGAGDDEIAVLKAALAMPMRFTFTGDERQALLSDLKAENARFLNHPLVGLSREVWA